MVHYVYPILRTEYFNVTAQIMITQTMMMMGNPSNKEDRPRQDLEEATYVVVQNEF